VYGREFAEARSGEIVRLIEAVARKHGLRFVDSTSFIRERSAVKLVHGPHDWKHFNRTGYLALSEAICVLIEGERAEGG